MLIGILEDNRGISFTAECELYCGTGLSDIDALAEICIGGLVLGVFGEDNCIGESCDIDGVLTNDLFRVSVNPE